MFFFCGIEAINELSDTLRIHTLEIAPWRNQKIPMFAVGYKVTAQ